MTHPVIEKCQQGRELSWAEYCEGANCTLSNKFYGYGEKGYPVELALPVMLEFISAGEDLDRLKKALFYGKNLEETIGRHEALAEFSSYKAPKPVKDGVIDATWTSEVDPLLIHAILGIATEAVELVQSLYSSLVCHKPIDFVNLGEELGDLLCYMHIFWAVGIWGCWWTKEGIDLNPILRKNLLKLYLRYGDKFSEAAAINRNLEAEREVLESGELTSSNP